MSEHFSGHLTLRSKCARGPNTSPRRPRSQLARQAKWPSSRPGIGKRRTPFPNAGSNIAHSERHGLG
eukprot:10303350-Alexandrium_andersonii.AAC.1